MDCKKLLHILQTQCQIQMDWLLVVGVSGGPDSLCLLDLLHKAGAKLIALHVNHQLRPTADLEADQLKIFCQKNGIDCLIEKLNVPEYALEHKISTEEAARILRYQFLFTKARDLGAKAVLVAHHADDQAETILMHILRGTGLSGLKGMQMHSLQPQWSETIPLVRPLLTTSRQEILEYCREHKLSPSMDESNEDVRYFRNRLRHDLLPELSSYNPQIKERLIHLGEVAKVEDDFIQQEAGIFAQRLINKKKDNYLIYSRSGLRRVHEALIRRILRQAVQSLLPEQKDIDFMIISRAVDFVQGKIKVNQLLLLADLELIKSARDDLIICHKDDLLPDLWPQLDDNQEIPIDLNGATPLGQNWQFTCYRTDQKPELLSGGLDCIVDGSRINKLFANVMRTGERFDPFNLDGESIKLGDFWTKQKLPGRARNRWPLVKQQDGVIVWIPGFQISNQYKITPASREFMVMRLEQQKTVG